MSRRSGQVLPGTSGQVFETSGRSRDDPAKLSRMAGNTDIEDYEALGVAIELVAAHRRDADDQFGEIIGQFVGGASTDEERDQRLGLVYRSLISLSCQLADVLDQIKPGTADQWIESTRALARSGPA
jgi:hypothetical protein